MYTKKRQKTLIEKAKTNHKIPMPIIEFRVQSHQPIQWDGQMSPKKIVLVGMSNKYVERNKLLWSCK